MKRIVAVLVIGGAGLAGCGGAKEQPAVPTAEVSAVPVAQRTLEQVVVGYGQIEFVPGQSTALVVEVESRVAAVLVAAGARVRAGQPIVTLRPSAQTLLELDRSTREATLAAGEARRLQRLRDEGLATDAESLAAAAQAATLAQLRDSLASRTGAGREVVLRAARDAIVDSLAVQPGDLLAAGTPVARLGYEHGLQARIGLEVDDALRVAAGAPARVRLPQSAATPLAGLVTSIERRLDKDTHLAAASIALPADAGLMAGVAVEGRVVVATHSGLAVPVGALVHDDDALAVYVVKDGKAQRRVVTVGIDDGAYVELLSGVAAGESVVVVGNHELVDGMAVRPVAGIPAAKGSP
jgi:RND family efflux transporter MFP subunit